MSHAVIGEVTQIERVVSQMLLIKATLRLHPLHDPVEAIRVLLTDGREAFERLRGEPCDRVNEYPEARMLEHLRAE